MHVHPQGIHVGEPFLGRPARPWRQLLASAAHHGILSATGVLLAPQGVPVTATLRGPPEALGSQVGMNVDTAHGSLLV